MDEVILDSLLYQASIGQRNGGTFSSSAYTYVVNELRSKFPETTWNKEKFNGWDFNPVTNMWDLEDEVWDEIIKANPNVAKWKDKPIPFYDKLEELYGKDRATGDNAVTAAEIRAWRKSVTPKILLLQLRKLMHHNNVGAMEKEEKESCLEDIDFDQRYKSNAYIHLCRNRVDYDILTALPLDGRGPVLWNMIIQVKVISVTEPSPYNSNFI
ncbi:hypothetical protein LIER_42878 [Lithospermum erythrorhizon]|uniref:Uncharacterized protein n=1 Tax=Lithospermum erythrorhizon TaxID=34254 RepID=A0AAV3P221_LITER